MRTLFIRFQVSDDEENDCNIVMEELIEICNDWVRSVYPQFESRASGKQNFNGNYITIEESISDNLRFWKMKRSEEGKKDKLLEGMPASIRVLLGHKEACDITPPNSVLLASNESCPVQMFRLKQNIYATQFHPEGDSDEFTVRIHVYKSYGYFPAEKADDLLESIEAERGKVDYAHAILKRFVDFYRAAS